MLTSKEIRHQFLDFFKQKGHEIVPSSPVVLKDDPTLLFTNAGMNQFKDIFLGHGKRDYTRASDTQKCIRVSGKHNDLEEVGRDGYHHTFFEMLGNWSFGDYYKKEAITWAWELLTEVWKLDKNKLFVTVYKDDDEAAELWHTAAGVPKERILRFGNKDNFWEMGETGPCGPCSEIHYDRGDAATQEATYRDKIKGVNGENDRYIEIWNLVFMQYNRKQDGTLEDLPAKHVDTGMGFARVVSILQNTTNNYETDIFKPIIDAIAKISGVPYTSGEDGIPHQVIADHIRMISICIGDGVLPSNLGRGYVVRRILRRAARFGRKLGMEEPFMYKLVDTLIDLYGEIFPELPAQRDFISQVIRAEESSFKKNLDRGIKLFDDLTGGMKSGETIEGKDLFTLYDTYGFPVDMTAQMAEERGLNVDLDGYEKALTEAKERSREGAGGVTADWMVFNETENAPFLGYEESVSEVQIAKYRPTGEQDKEGRDILQLMLTRTPFYGESGGQMGDTGTISSSTFMLKVHDTQKIEGQNVSIATLISGELDGEPATAAIDEDRRADTRRNHSATHLLHQALKDVLGDHVQQKGSLVGPDSLRFDFSHFEGVKPEELRRAEDIVNSKILENLPLTVDQKSIEDAKAMGAQALFGEKYGDVVRVVSMGDYSRELCGGTHVNATGDIGFLKIISEGSISAGIRRIEALTGSKAYAYSAKNEILLNEIAASLKCLPEEAPARLESLSEKAKRLQKENDRLRQKILVSAAGEIASKAEEINGTKVICRVVESPDADALKTLAQSLKDKMGSGICVLGAAVNEKAIIVVGTTDDLVAKGVKSGAIIGPVARIVGGGGGGHPRLAQAGGKDPSKLDEAIKQALDIVKENLPKE